MEILKYLLSEGYQHVVRDKDINYLSCFSQKPKKYTDTEMWGYTDQQLKIESTKPVYSFKNEDITEINWNNRSAILIEDWLERSDMYVD